MQPDANSNSAVEQVVGILSAVLQDVQVLSFQQNGLNKFAYLGLRGSRTDTPNTSAILLYPEARLEPIALPFMTSGSEALQAYSIRKAAQRHHLCRSHMASVAQ